MSTADEREKFRRASAERLRIFRLSRGHETAASFARAIGYPPDKYRRYERRGFDKTGPLLRLVTALDEAGLGLLSIDWLVFGDPIRLPPKVAGAKVAIFPRAKIERLAGGAA